MSEDFLDKTYVGLAPAPYVSVATLPAPMMPAVAMLWAGVFTAMFYATGTMIAYLYAQD